MMGHPLVILVVLVILLGVSVFFSGSETALTFHIIPFSRLKRIPYGEVESSGAFAFPAIELVSIQ